MNQERQVVVVGAGQAGIASALALKDAGIGAVVLDRADRVASAWRGRYDGLRLNTWRRFSHLPGRPYPKGTPTFPSREEVIEHVERHAGEDGIELRMGTSVERIDRDGEGWTVETDAGPLRTREVIVATGVDATPRLPDWPGREAFSGPLLHSSEYANAEPFVDQGVLVVGPGCSGMEIARELVDAGASKVWLAVRTPPNILLRQGPGPVPGDLIATALWHLPTRLADRIARLGARMDFGDLSEYGLPAPETGVFTGVRELDKVPTIADAEAIEAIKEGAIEVVRAVESLDSDGVALADGTRIAPDAVICATGHRPGLEPLVGHLGVLGERGMPKQPGPRPALPGLRFIGYLLRPGGLGYMGKQARRSARAIARELRGRPRVPSPRLTKSARPAMNLGADGRPND
ncbi:MAG: flavin-containing monooxygenase [Solirubrobacterales bacterium]